MENLGFIQNLGIVPMMNNYVFGTTTSPIQANNINIFGIDTSSKSYSHNMFGVEDEGAEEGEGEETPVFSYNAASNWQEAIRALQNMDDMDMDPYSKLLYEKSNKEQILTAAFGNTPFIGMLLKQNQAAYEVSLKKLREDAANNPDAERDGSWYAMNGEQAPEFEEAWKNGKASLKGIDKNTLYSQYFRDRSFYRKKVGNNLDPAGTAQDMVSLAKSFIGRVNSDREGNRLFSGGKSQAWCADFAREMAKATFGIDFGGTASVSGIREWGIKNRCYHDAKGYTPKVGDLVIEKNGKSHVSIVTKVYPDGSYDTVEGNHNNKVGTRHVKPGTRTVSGFVALSEYQYYKNKRNA